MFLIRNVVFATILPRYDVTTLQLNCLLYNWNIFIYKRNKNKHLYYCKFTISDKVQTFNFFALSLSLSNNDINEKISQSERNYH